MKTAAVLIFDDAWGIMRTRTLFKKREVSLAWRLDKKRGLIRLIPHETVVGRVSFRIFTFYISLYQFERNYIIAGDQKRDEHDGASFQSSPKINRMLITRLICIQ